MPSYYPPGTHWQTGTVISADELNNISSNDLRLTYVPPPAPPEPDECRHCGCPSPESPCHYCGTRAGRDR
jgi:hypothetical protein